MDRIGFRPYVDDDHDDDLPPEVREAWDEMRSAVEGLLDAWDELGATMSGAKQDYDTLMAAWGVANTMMVAMRREVPPRFSQRFFSLGKELKSMGRKFDAMLSAYRDEEK